MRAPSTIAIAPRGPLWGWKVEQGTAHRIIASGRAITRAAAERKANAIARQYDTVNAEWAAILERCRV